MLPTALLERQPLNGLALSRVGESGYPVPRHEVATMPGEKAQKLNAESVRGWLRTQKGWKRRSNQLTKQFEFGSFRDSIVFVNRVATLADEVDHHPDIDIRYSRVTVTLTTHDAGGITGKDLKLAEQIDFATSAN
jgi:4a-hydroxytetrahydrobiopterin dehydratase